MDFIERWFGVSPDGGSGALEAIYIAAVALAAGTLAFRRRLARRARAVAARFRSRR